MPSYQNLLTTLRQAFPQPISDPVHDGYVVFSILRALDQVDALKSQTPILGSPTAPDYVAARASRTLDKPQTLEAVTAQLVHYLQGMFIWGHPRAQINVVPNPTIASLIGVLLPLAYNPNLCSDESSRLFAEAEVRAVAMTAALVGYPPDEAGGVFTFGGTGGVLYGLKIGLEKALPGSGVHGLRESAVVLTSAQSHYCCLTAAAWLGIGQDGVIAVPTGPDNAIRVDALEAAAREALAAGKHIAAIVATLGTTDAFGIDDLEAIDAMRQRLVEEFSLSYVPHLHADAVIGWAWSVFNDYDFEANPLEFRGRTVRALAAAHDRIRHLPLADSIGIDFHKTGYAPYVSALVLVRRQSDLTRIARPAETMPYLYQSGEHHPGFYTLETTRSATGPMAALANLLLLGKEGYRVLLGHAVEMSEVLRERIESNPHLTVLNHQNVGPVTLFRAYPDKINTFTVPEREQHDASYRDRLQAHNDYNRRIFARVQAEALSGHGVVLSLTSCYRQTDYGQPIVALKSYVLSPFSDESRMESV
ncbi:MAG TPA: pyridoxal-dependent decarboxylase, partial [Pirellulales bacterium]|nr:pyridoxal-dependent decarboxylase [Pirellulales bacterium]